MTATFKALISVARSRLAVGFIVLLPLAGCATMAPKLEAPRLTVVSIGMVSADIFSQQFRVRLHVQNPNSRSIPIKGIDYELFLEGDSFAEGTASEPFVVPARGENEFDMTAKTNFVSSIGRLLSRMNGRDSSRVGYAIAGKVAIDIPFVKAIPFQDTGSLDLGMLR
jgi:LEA14-like dessication related protein